MYKKMLGVTKNRVPKKGVSKKRSLKNGGVEIGGVKEWGPKSWGGGSKKGSKKTSKNGQKNPLVRPIYFGGVFCHFSGVNIYRGVYFTGPQGGGEGGYPGSGGCPRSRKHHPRVPWIVP